MLPPSPSLHQARIIPAQIPTGKNNRPTHSLGLTCDGLKPSPTKKARTSPMLATVQALAVHRITRVSTRRVSDWPSIVYPRQKEHLPHLRPVGLKYKFSCVGNPTPTTLEQPKTVVGAIDVRSARQAPVNCKALNCLF